MKNPIKKHTNDVILESATTFITFIIFLFAVYLFSPVITHRAAASSRSSRP